MAVITLAGVLILALITRGAQARELNKLFANVENSMRSEFAQARKEQASALSETRSELDAKLSGLGLDISSRLHETGGAQNKLIAELVKNVDENIARLNVTTDARLRGISENLDKKLTDVQRDNFEKLEKIRLTVDERLHNTLERRLGESFKTVSDRLEQVHKGLGEMRGLAQGVGDLKKTLSNVKTRGIFGEIQLEAILEQIFTSSQYEKNFSPKPGVKVEFALRLPGAESPVYLVIDSKFPLDSYDRLQDAYDLGDANAVATARKELALAVKKSAKDINEKYINPPVTVDFGVMFLPSEGLYAEVLRVPGLVDGVLRERVVISGPTTFSALLNSLQMGFKTLAIEKRSGEVWKILGAIKTEFDKFGVSLEAAQKHIQAVDKDIENLVGVRTRQIIKTLRNVETAKMINDRTLEDSKL
jgi:DNA recombination protein RmuC